MKNTGNDAAASPGDRDCDPQAERSERASAAGISGDVTAPGPCTPAADDPADPDGTEARIAVLMRCVTPERLAAFERAAAMRTRYLTVVAENTYHGQNAAALVRHCEAFGIQQMHTVETLCPFRPSADVVRGTDKWVDIMRHDSTAAMLASLRAAGYRIVATTPHRRSCTPESLDVGAGPIALVFGTEREGSHRRSQPPPTSSSASPCAAWSRASTSRPRPPSCSTGSPSGCGPGPGAGGSQDGNSGNWCSAGCGAPCAAPTTSFAGRDSTPTGKAASLDWSGTYPTEAPRPPSQPCGAQFGRATTGKTADIRTASGQAAKGRMTKGERQRDGSGRCMRLPKTGENRVKCGSQSQEFSAEQSMRRRKGTDAAR